MPAEIALLPTVSSKPSSNLRILAKFAGLWLVGWIASIALGVISNTDPAQGATIGAIEGIFTAFFYGGISLVAAEVGARLGRAIGSQGSAKASAFGVSLLWVGILSFAVGDRLHPERSLKRWTGVSFPVDAVVQSSTQTTGGLADDSYTFAFTCDASETERLIRELKLPERLNAILPAEADEFATIHGWRPTKSWSQVDLGGSPDYIRIMTDDTLTKVYLEFGQI